MLQVKSQGERPDILHEDAALTWHEITGKELSIAVQGNGTTQNVNLEIKQDGRKTPTVVQTLASIEIPENVVEKYADEPLLAETMVAFAFEHYRGNIERISRLMNLLFESRRLIDLTAVKTIEIIFALRVDRDEDTDEVIGESVTATVGTQKFVYSNAGVFDKEV